MDQIVALLTGLLGDLDLTSLLGSLAGPGQEPAPAQ